MPIIDIHFENSILFAKEIGEISEEDALEWAHQVQHYAEHSPTPIVALIDAIDVKFISHKARKIFIKAANTRNFKASAVATHDQSTIQTARVLGIMAPDKHTYIFDNLEQAHQFALELANGASVI